MNYKQVGAWLGVIVLCSGCWWAYPPAALIVFGALLLAAAVVDMLSEENAE